MLLSTLFPPGSGGAKQPEAGGAGPAALKVNSYAKINWSLDLLYRREDGYHELRTVFQTISIYDRLLIGETPGDIEIVCSDPIVPTDHSNLVYKAAAALREAAGIRRGARIEIDKRIPVAAGLGGGSSNAAAALVALAKLWRVELDVQELFRIAAALGSDVPYFLVGGTALGTGRGEEVYPLEEVSCAGLLLVNPGTRVSTADAYGRYSRLTRAGKARIMPFALLAAKGVHALPLAGGNDLEEAVLTAHPEIAEVRQKLLSLGAMHALMSGSGATVFGVFDNLEAAARARDGLRMAGCWAECVHTISRDAYSRALLDRPTAAED